MSTVKHSGWVGENIYTESCMLK